jgi:uncharacterized protein with PIN domain
VSVRFLFDVHVPKAIAEQLRLRGIDVLTAQEDGCDRLADPALLDRATALRRVLVTYDDDLLREARQRQDAGVPFAGVVYSHQAHMTVGRAVADLELVALTSEPADLANRVEHLPLR